MSIEIIEKEILGDASASTPYAKDGEVIFQRMKKLAGDAGWPSSLTSEIVSIDKDWQKAKEDVNAAKGSGFGSSAPASAAQQMAVVVGKLKSMVARLETFLKDRPAPQQTTPSSQSTDTPSSGVPSSSGPPASTPGGAPPGNFLDTLTQYYGPLPMWGWGALGVGLIVAGSFLIPRRR